MRLDQIPGYSENAPKKIAYLSEYSGGWNDSFDAFSSLSVEFNEEEIYSCMREFKNDYLLVLREITKSPQRFLRIVREK